MRAADLYDYAVIRVVPRVERAEFINAGVILSSAATKFLQARIELDEARLIALAPDVDIETVRRHLAAVSAICAGTPGSGPIAQLPQRARFHWLTAPRSAIIQTSPVHAGRCANPQAAIEHLVARLVMTPPRASPKS
ncbi:MAG: DUF3037 domain-containing protein [Tahibacter sp.]